MEYTWRWFGASDPVSLQEVRQTGATGIVTALHHVPNGDVWSPEDIHVRQAEVAAAGLQWSVVESVPIHEHIKWGGPLRDQAVEAYVASLRNLAAAGLSTVCYNFMPVLDWTRTDLDASVFSGGRALTFGIAACAAFDVFDLQRPGAEGDYSEQTLESARAWWDTASGKKRRQLRANILAGLPGSEESYTVDTFRAALEPYSDLNATDIRGNLLRFLEDVTPTADALGMKLAVHPDDPPRDLFGLPRVVSTAEDVEAIFAGVPSEANALTLCVGSFASRVGNDPVAIARQFADRIAFIHLRNVHLAEDDASFVESDHLDGDVDMVAVIGEIVAEEHRRRHIDVKRACIPMRPDHGHRLLDDFRRETRPGYPLIGRMRGLAQLMGVERAVTSHIERLHV